MAYMNKPGNVDGRFGSGMTNPSFGGFMGFMGGGAGGIRKPTHRVPGGGGGGGVATVYSGAPPYNPWLNTGPNQAQGSNWDSFKNSRGTSTHNPGTGTGTPGWLMKMRREASGAFGGGGASGMNFPDMPEARGVPEFSGWEGEKWSPETSGVSGGPVDTAGLIDATAALIDERMGGEMADAARKFGDLGMLSSGGGLGSGYMGTLGESQRGRDRDIGEMTHRYRFQAEQADAAMREAARQAALDRSLSAHEGEQNRGFGSHMRGVDYGLDTYDRDTDSDRWSYDKEMEREILRKQAEKDNLNTMMLLYGG
jgi:hypothetical protein